MQQRSETVGRRKGGVENEWDLRSRVKIETNDRRGGCCTELTVDIREKSHGCLREASKNT